MDHAPLSCHRSPRHWLRAALLAPLLLGATLIPAHAAHAARGLQVGIQDDSVFVTRAYYNRTKALAQTRALGVSWMRVNVGWASVASSPRSRRVPRKITYNWGSIDFAIDQAARYGIHVQLTLDGPAPAWATANHRVGVYKPNARLFGQFAAAAAQHFAQRHVGRYEIWNEPNWGGWLAPLRQGPSLYRALYEAAYKVIKQVDPTIQVLIGNTSPYYEPGRSTAPLAFLRGVACVNARWQRVNRCATLHADGYAHHPYDLTRPVWAPYPGADNVTLATLWRLDDALARLGRSGALRYTHGGAMPIYLTEYGTLESTARGLPQNVRARYLSTAFDMAERAPHVKELVQFLLIQPPARFRVFDTAIMTPRGRPVSSYWALWGWTRTAFKRGLATKPPLSFDPFAAPPPGQPAQGAPLVQTLPTG